MRKSLFLISLSICLVSLCSCSTKQIYTQEKISAIRFSWWGNDVRNEYTIDGIKVFEEENEFVEITPEYGEFVGFKSKMDMEIYSETEADVMQVNYDWLHEYSQDETAFYDLYELSDYIDLSNFTEEDLSYGTVDGKLYGIPTSLNALTFYTNKSLYDSYGLEIPKTWEDYFEVAKVMKRDEVYPLALSEKGFWLSCCAYYEQKTGISPFDENGNFNYTEDDIEELITFYMRLINGKVSKRAEDFKRSDFENCLCGAMASWISDAEYFFGPSQEMGLEVVMADYPVTANSYKSFGWYIKPSSLYAIKKETQESKTSAKFVNYLLNSEDMYSLQGCEKGIPVSKSALEVLTARDLLTGLQYDATEKMKNEEEFKPMSPYLENDKLIGYFTDACDKVYYEKMTIEFASAHYYSYMKNCF